MAFRNILFPTDFCISYQSTMGEQFNTRVTSPGGNAAEGRNAEWGENSRHTFEPVTNVIGVEDLERLQAFHAAVQGRAYAFRLEWPGDNSAVDSLIDTSDGGDTFQLRKEYEVTVYSYDGSDTSTIKAYKPIYLCIPETAYLTLNGIDVPVEENPANLPLWNEGIFNGGNLSASITNGGVITLSEEITSDDVLRATFNYQYCVRFVNDEMRIQLISYNAFSVSCPMIECFGEEFD